MYGKKLCILREIECVCCDSPLPKIQHVADTGANMGYILRERTVH